MAKEVELDITIDKNGKINAVPKGTVGTECLELMKFLDKLNGVKNVKTSMNQDMKLNENITNNIENKLN